MDLVQELLNVQAKYGELTAANVLKAAKFKKSPLHNCFDWNDTDAAAKWRLHQANMLIVKAEVTITPHENRTVKAFVSVRVSEDKPRHFVHVPEAMNDNALAAQIFDQLAEKIERIEQQLENMQLLYGATKKALREAKRPIQRRAKSLRKSA